MSIKVSFSKQLYYSCIELGESEDVSSILSSKQLRIPLKPKSHWSDRQYKRNDKKTMAAVRYSKAKLIDDSATRLCHEIDRDIVQAIVEQCYAASSTSINFLGNQR